MPAPRATILDAAAKLFAAHGFEGASLNDVAQAVGVTKAAVYHYFPTKKDIFDEMMVDLLERQYAAVSGEVNAAEGPSEKLKAFMRAQAEFLEANHAVFVVMLHGFGGIEKNHWTQQQLALRDRYEKLLRALLADGKASGAFAVDDVATVARAVLSLMNWMVRWFRPEGKTRAADFALQYHALIVSGLQPRIQPENTTAGLDAGISAGMRE